MIIGTQPKAPAYPAPRPPRAQSVMVAIPRAASLSEDSTSAKLLVIASLMSLVVVGLSLAVLHRTTAGLFAATPTPTPVPEKSEKIEKAEAPVKPPAPSADLMLMLDVEPKDASLVVRRSEAGYQVQVAAEGYESEVRTVEKGVRGKIAVKLAHKKELPKKKKTKKVAKKKAPVKGPAKPGEVFLTGGDL